MQRFVKESVIHAPRQRVFAFHERPDALALLTPPWEQTRIVKPPASLKVGTVVVLKTKLGPFWLTLEAEHVAYEEGVRFEDVLRRGPFAHWHHRHVFLDHGEHCLLRDEIEYALPLGTLGRLCGGRVAQRRMERLFEYRHEVTRREVEA